MFLLILYLDVLLAELTHRSPRPTTVLVLRDRGEGEMVLTVLAFGRPLRAGCGVRGQFWDRKRFLAIFAGFLGMELVLKLSLKYVVRLLVIDVDHFGAELAATDVAATVGLVQVDLVGGKPLLAILATYLFLFHSSDLILQPQLN